MPNKRDPDKVLMSCYVERDLRDMMRKALKECGISFTDFVLSKMMEFLSYGADEILRGIKSQDARTIEGKAKRNRQKNANNRPRSK